MTIPNTPARNQKPHPTADSIKRQVSLETVLAHYGTHPPSKGKFPCPCSANHKTGDSHPSANVFEGRVYCHSQNCFGKKGADIFELVAAMEGCSDFKEQRDFIVSAFLCGGAQPSKKTVAASPKLQTKNAVKPKPTLGELVAVYVYVDEQGKVLFQGVRFDPKDFRQCQPDGKGGWLWHLEGVRLVLYGLPRIAISDTVVIVEGEKDADLINLLTETQDIAGTTSPMGAGKWRPEYSESLRGKRVVIVPDRDGPGLKHGDEVAAALAGIASEVLIVDLPKGKDISEWAELTKAKSGDLIRLLEKAKPVTPSPHLPLEQPIDKSAGDEASDTGKRRESMASKMVELVLGNDPEFFHNKLDEPFISFQDSLGRWHTQRVDGDGFKKRLTHQAFVETGKAPSGSALSDTVALLSARAVVEGPQHETWLRFGGDEKGLFIDLCRDDKKIISITSSGWKVIEARADTRFVKCKTMLPLPTPLRSDGGGDGLHAMVEKLINSETDDDAILFTGFLLGIMNPHGSKVIALILGPQGSGKTSAANLFNQIINPNVLEGSSLGADENDFMIHCNNNAVPTVDNLSNISNDWSDFLCRISTGSAFLTRTKFTNSEATIFSCKRPIVLNGIVDFVYRSDLLDRSILIHMKKFESGERRGEDGIKAAFKKQHPELLGKFCDVIAATMKNMECSKFHTDERLTDFLKWVDAASPVLGWPTGLFLEAFQKSRSAGDSASLEASLIAGPLLDLVSGVVGGTLELTMGELLEELSNAVPERVRRLKYWPKHARGLRGDLERIAPTLEKVGMKVAFLNRVQKGRLVRISYTPPPTPVNQGNSPAL